MARNNKTSETLFQFMNHLITLLHQNGQHRTMQHYKATLKATNATVPTETSP